MRFLVFAAFVGVPLIEIVVFIEIGGWLGLWPTIAVVVLTALVGTALLRAQGLATLRRAQTALARNEIPVAEVFHGLCLLLAGALLLTPGFVTDAVGLLLFVPTLRAAMMAWAWRMLRMRRGRGTGIHGDRGGGAGFETVIDGEFHEVDPDRDERVAANDPQRIAEDRRPKPETSDR